MSNISIQDIPQNEVEQPIENYSYNFSEQGDTSAQVSTEVDTETLKVTKEENRHNEWLTWFNRGSILVLLEVVILFVIWVITIFLSTENKEFLIKLNVFDTFKTLLLTTLGYIFGTRNNGSDK